VELEQLFGPFSPPETNFLDRLRYWAVAQPDRVAYRFLERGEIDDQIQILTTAQLDERVRAVAAKLMSMGMLGQRALLMYPPGLDFVIAFYACHYAGVTPVPAYPPRRNRNMARINSIADDAKASVVLTDRSIIKRWYNEVREDFSLGTIPWLATESIPLELAEDWTQPKISGRDLALIQYTSGSTGSPKGVMLTHDNLISNCRMITRAFQIDRNGAGCSWLPLYHDMGLIGGMLIPMYCGIPDTLMSPVAFLTQPIRWLEAISKFRGTASGGPNFAYALCTMKIDPSQCEHLDLSCWEVAFNGAEPVRADVLDQFSKKFAPFGFNPKAFYPCYGMAETTLIVTGGSKHDPPVIRPFKKNDLVEHRVVRTTESDRDGRRLVGCGQVLQEEEVLIVNPETRRPLPDDQIGEIWINSPSCGLGYWQRPVETKEVFLARLNPDNGKVYVRSGDLGFMDRGELFVAGRLKDMIIVRGVNRYPQDIEATVEHCHPLTRSGGCAAFAVTRWDREHLVIVCEIEKTPGRQEYDEVIQAIRSAVTDEHDLPPDAIVLVRAYSVPKTSSGKVQRHACKKSFESGEDMVELARWCSWEVSEEPIVREKTNETERNANAMDMGDLAPAVVEAVIHFVKQVGQDRAKQVTLDTNVVHLGLDSLERLDIAQSLQTAFGGQIPEEVLQEVETVRQVARAVQTYIGTKPVSADFNHRNSATDSKKPATPIPESYYRLEKMPEFLRLGELKRQITDTGVRNPFFSVHEGRISDTTRIDGRTLISFASYNYLGLSGHPEVNASAKQAIDQFGTSVSASRIVSGEKTIHKQLEAELSEFLGVDDVITFPGGHATNESVIGHLVGPGDLIVHDSLAHNSIIQGAELSGARRRPFGHNDWRELNRILKENRGDYRRVLIALEGLYSMDGDYPDLPRFVDIKKRYQAWLYVDEAHSIGTMGATGRGIAEVYDVNRSDVECWMGTLSKAFGSCGGFVGGSSALIEYLRYTTPGYVFAAGMPPANVGAALGSLRILKRHPELVTRLQKNSQLFLSLARAAGLNTGLASGTPITPVITGASILALRLSEALFDAGINAQPILYPAVAEQETRVRIFMTAAHSEEQIRSSVQKIADCWTAIREGSNPSKSVFEESAR
jgi:8-amino-7-oxononanoate synthase/acyl carrier protein